MTSVTKDLKTFAMLMILLFVIAVVVAVTYIGSGFLKQAACTIEDSDYVWEAGLCRNSTVATGGTEQTVTSIDKIELVEATIDIALALLTLVVVIAVFALVIRSARSFEGMSK